MQASGMAKKKPENLTAFNEESVTNGGQEAIETQQNYFMKVTVQGVSDLLFHRWDCAAVKVKSEAKKGSEGKKSDNLESYVYRMDGADSNLAMPSEYFRQSIIGAAKFRQDPRSPRKSAMDLFKAGIVTTTILCDLGIKNWHYVDRRRVVVQRNAITRERPALREGWEASFEIGVLLPEYIGPRDLVETINMAGRVIGVADFRPTFGRYVIKNWVVE
jgi:hypothetical protein